LAKLACDTLSWSSISCWWCGSSGYNQYR
jgi:hypothetical protein